MKRRIIQPWTPSDDERLRKLAAEGRSSVTIVERMKRSPKSILSRARALKIVLRRANASEPAQTVAEGEPDKRGPVSMEHWTPPKAVDTQFRRS